MKDSKDHLGIKAVDENLKSSFLVPFVVRLQARPSFLFLCFCKMDIKRVLFGIK